MQWRWHESGGYGHADIFSRIVFQFRVPQNGYVKRKLKIHFLRSPILSLYYSVCRKVKLESYTISMFASTNFNPQPQVKSNSVKNLSSVRISEDTTEENY